jgi:hypothetical protein
LRVAQPDAGAIAEMKARIAALEAAIRELKEENKRLRDRKTPPPPKVQVRSRRV